MNRKLQFKSVLVLLTLVLTFFYGLSARALTPYTVELSQSYANPVYVGAGPGLVVFNVTLSSGMPGSGQVTFSAAKSAYIPAGIQVSQITNIVHPINNLPVCGQTAISAGQTCSLYLAASPSAAGTFSGFELALCFNGTYCYNNAVTGFTVTATEAPATPQATISTSSPVNYDLRPGELNQITVTNNSQVAAENVSFISAPDGVDIASNAVNGACNNLAPGKSCTLYFTVAKSPSRVFVPIQIAGANTNVINLTGSLAYVHASSYSGDAHLQYKKITVYLAKTAAQSISIAAPSVSSSLQNYVHVCANQGDSSCEADFSSTCPSTLSPGGSCYFWVKSLDLPNFVTSTHGVVAVNVTDGNNNTVPYNFYLNYQMGLYFAGTNVYLNNSQNQSVNLTNSIVFFDGKNFQALGGNGLYGFLPLCPPSGKGNIFCLSPATTAVIPPTPVSVRAATLYHGDLYFGGLFNQINNQNAKNIAAWNGEKFNANLCGLSSTNLCGPVVSNQEPGIFSMQAFQGALYIGGAFQNVINGNNTIQVNNIAQWSANSQAFNPVGIGLPSADLKNPIAVYALAAYNNSLYIGGQFTNPASPSELLNIINWNGSDWHQSGVALKKVDHVTNLQVLNTSNNSQTLYATAASSDGHIIYQSGALPNVWISPFPKMDGKNVSASSIAYFSNSYVIAGDFQLKSPASHFIAFCGSDCSNKSKWMPAGQYSNSTLYRNGKLLAFNSLLFWSGDNGGISFTNQSPSIYSWANVQDDNGYYLSPLTTISVMIPASSITFTNPPSMLPINPPLLPIYHQ